MLISSALLSSTLAWHFSGFSSFLRFLLFSFGFYYDFGPNLGLYQVLNLFLVGFLCVDGFLSGCFFLVVGFLIFLKEKAFPYNIICVLSFGGTFLLLGLEYVISWVKILSVSFLFYFALPG